MQQFISMPQLAENLGWYALSAFVFGFVFAWGLCAPAEPIVVEGERRRRWIDRLWRGYRAYDKGAGWWDRMSWLFGFFKTNAGVAMLVGTTAAAGTYAAIEIRHNVIEPLQSQAAIEAVPKEDVRQTQNSFVFAIDGKDKAGRRGTFDVVVLNKSFLWVRGSADQLEKEGKVIASDELATVVLDPEVRAALAGALEVIAVGTASQEGNAADEQARAGRRAASAAKLVSGAVTGNIPVWALNLGQYRNPCTDCETAGTSWQRPFIVIAVTSLEPDTNLGEALADAMSGKERLPSPESYSTFALTRIR
jgi:hypothetical protein